MAPVVNPAAMSAPFSPNARARRGPSGKAVVRRDRAAGVTMAVAMPWATRAAISTPGDVARPPIREETPRIAMPRRNSRRRPNRSATRPNSRVKPAAHRANEVDTHCRFSKREPHIGADGGHGDIEDGKVDRKGEAGSQQDREDEPLTYAHVSSRRRGDRMVRASVRARQGVSQVDPFQSGDAFGLRRSVAAAPRTSARSLA